MEVLQIAKLMYEKTMEIAIERTKIAEQAQKKAESIGLYRKQKAIMLMKLQHGEFVEQDAIKVDAKLPVSIMKEVADGLCYKEKIEADLQDALYKGLISNLDGIKAELNGLQSINKYLEGID